LLGSFSWLTTFAATGRGLALARVLTGLALGGALPNFIAIASETAPARRRLSTVAVVMTGMPCGGVLAGLTALGAGIAHWRTIFVVGGAGPLLLAALLWSSLPRAPARARAPGQRASLDGVSRVLFGTGRLAATLALWGGFFFTQLILLLLLNWLPSLFIGLGYSSAQASLAAVCFNLCGAAGTALIARLHSGATRLRGALLTYLGIAASLALIPLAAHHLWFALLAVSLVGVFAVGAQMVLFATAPLCYEKAIRGTGVGAAVAVGRLGSIVGPLYAGALLSAGMASAGVLIGILPFVGAAAAAVLVLGVRTRPTST